MRKMFHATLLVLFVMSSSALADVIKLDDVFTKSNQWLKKENLSLTGSPSGRDDIAAFSQETILFYGEAAGNPAHVTPAQREIMAKKAAEAMAKRAVVEYLEGFALVGDTLVKDSMAQYDVVRTSVAGFSRGVLVVSSEYSKEKDTAVAIVKLSLHGPRGFASSMYEKLLSDPKMKKDISTTSPAFSAKHVAMDAAYDGLIIDASDQNFKPALINRIFAEKGEVLYDPAKIEKKTLVEQGCGEYTNTVNKAKEALAKRGVKNPLVVTATGTASAADLKVSDDDAANVFSANQNGNFFKVAKVAFVLK